MPTRVTVVSDSHLAASNPSATEQWDAVVGDLSPDPPDLVVHAGDITCDGCSEPDQLDYARELLDRVPGPLVSVPGNHDLGENSTGQEGYDHVPVDAGRLARYRAAIGTDRFATTAGTWRIVGANSMLFGTGLPDEAEQWEWLGSELAPDRDGGPMALVLHKPLLPPPGQRDGAARYVPPDARARLRSLLAGTGGRLVVSGHIHQSLRHTDSEGLDHLWAPTSWAVLPDDIQSLVGHKVVGVLDLTLHDDGRVDSAVRVPAGVRQATIGLDVDSPYGELPPLDR
jgi:3',5'-cyclic AMP phosphodiesterase CpdA